MTDDPQKVTETEETALGMVEVSFSEAYKLVKETGVEAFRGPVGLRVTMCRIDGRVTVAAVGRIDARSDFTVGDIESAWTVLSPTIPAWQAMKVVMEGGRVAPALPATGVKFLEFRDGRIVDDLGRTYDEVCRLNQIKPIAQDWLIDPAYRYVVKPLADPAGSSLNPRQVGPSASTG